MEDVRRVFERNQKIEGSEMMKKMCPECKSIQAGKVNNCYCKKCGHELGAGSVIIEGKVL